MLARPFLYAHCHACCWRQVHFEVCLEFLCPEPRTGLLWSAPMRSRLSRLLVLLV